MAAVEQARRKFKSLEEFDEIPGFDKALGVYVRTLKRCLADVTLSFNEAPRNGGVPPVGSVIGKYEVELRNLYGKLERLADEYDE